MPASRYDAPMRYFLAAAAAALLSTAAQAQDYTRYQGTWNGPFLFYFTQQDGAALGPPMVYPGTLQIEQDGNVHGSVPDAACLMAGKSADYVSPVNATIDL